jgi:hypothetical protein
MSAQPHASAASTQVKNPGKHWVDSRGVLDTFWRTDCWACREKNARPSAHGAFNALTELQRLTISCYACENTLWRNDIWILWCNKMWKRVVWYVSTDVSEGPAFPLFPTIATFSEQNSWSPMNQGNTGRNSHKHKQNSDVSSSCNV